MRPLRLLAAIGVSVAAGGSVAADPSPLIFPPQSLPLRFDHRKHLAMGIGCETCHTAAATSISGADNLIPSELACRACHAIDRAQPEKSTPAGQGPARCDSCHVGFRPGAEVARVEIPRPNLKFNHRLHVTRGIGCEHCHGGVREKSVATRDDLPHMPQCLECHDGKQAPSRCATCHLTLPDGRLRMELPGGRLAPSGSLRGFDAHTPSFRDNHEVAGQDEAYCATCHRRTECLDCHGAGVLRPLSIHPSDYIATHGMDARRNVPDCSSCHRSQTFCVGCHQRLGVASDPEGGRPGARPMNPFGTGSRIKLFHPPGWARDEAGAVIRSPGPMHHSFQASRNIRTCASCHREQTCLECHSTDGTRSATVSPHGPPGTFGPSSRCRSLSTRNRRACLKCHIVGSPEIECRD